MKKFLIALLCCLQAFATDVESYPSYNRVRKAATNHIYYKSYILFNLPNVSGGTVTAATLSLRVVSVTDGGVSVSTSAYVSETVGWDETSSTDLDSISALGAALDTKSINPATANNTTILFDVAGTTNGIKQCYADGKTQVTIIITQSTYSGTPTSTSTDLGVGDDRGSQIIFDTRAGIYKPLLTVTYTGGTVRRFVGTRVNGIGF